MGQSEKQITSHWYSDGLESADFFSIIGYLPKYCWILCYLFNDTLSFILGYFVTQFSDCLYKWDSSFTPIPCMDASSVVSYNSEHRPSLPVR